MTALFVLLGLLTAHATEVRGMTLSCPTWGWEWGSDAMVTSLDTLDGMGVNWVSIHPYARIHGDGRVEARGLDPEHPPDWLLRPIREAHARGQKVMIKPHLAYWGSPFAWRGAIRFDDPAAEARFFATYEAWVVALARITREADAFAVGTELDATLGDGRAWRGVIRSVREVHPGHLTYAANWDRFEAVPFWDAVDAIGVQAYFPVAEEGAEVSAAALDTAWDGWLARIRAVSERHGRPVVFTELGYDSSGSAAHAPWATGGGADEALQQACLDAALRAIDREPTVVGAFLWKWFPGDLPRGDFRMSAPGPRTVIERRWGPHLR